MMIVNTNSFKPHTRKPTTILKAISILISNCPAGQPRHRAYSIRRWIVDRGSGSANKEEDERQIAKVQCHLQIKRWRKRRVERVGWGGVMWRAEEGEEEEKEDEEEGA